MKKITSVLLCLILCFSLAIGAFAQSMKITVDGAEVKQVNVNGDPVPVLSEGTQGVMVPIRAVLNAMGYSVNYADGFVTGGPLADPAISFYAGEDGSFLVDGTTFVPYDMLENKNGVNYTAEVKDGEIAYTSDFAELTEGYYLISAGGLYLTGETLPAEDKVETVIDEDGNETEKVTTPQNQIRATNVVLEEKNDSDTQLWLIKKLNDKTYAVVNKHNGLALDVNGWSTDIGTNIIQYTLAGGTNQQWQFIVQQDAASDVTDVEIYSVHSDLKLESVADDKYGTGLDADNVIQASTTDEAVWQLQLIKPYVNPVELALETKAYKELDPYYQERFKTYFFTDVDFSQSAKNNAETFLRENGFEDADEETQQSLIIQSLDLTYSDLLGGWMREKLTANYEIIGVTRTADEHPEVLEQEDGKNYYIYTIAMECNGPDDIHTFTVETVDENDEEHVRRVCEAVACFEPPVRKTLRHFYYTGDNFGTWNAWDGEVWNNTGSKFDVDGMLTMFAHELGHVIDSAFKCGDDVWRRAIAKDIIPTSGYGKTNRWEDFGEFSRLYLMSRGDENRMAAIEAIYPNRTKTYQAALYNIDNEYYKQYKDCYDEVTASIGDTSDISSDMYYTLEYRDEALTNYNGQLTVSENKKADNQLWQIVVENDQLVKLYSKADGKAVVIPSIKKDEEAKTSIDGSTSLGLKKLDNGQYALTVSETGYNLFVLIQEGIVIAGMDESSPWILTPVEKIQGMGSFTLKSGGKYLVPSTEENGARLTLSDNGDMSVWAVNKLPNNVGYLTNTANGLAIDISGASEEEGAAALTYTLSRNANQMWLIETNENGTVSFKAQHSGLYLGVDNDGQAIQTAEKFEWTMEEVK